MIPLVSERVVSPAPIGDPEGSLAAKVLARGALRPLADAPLSSPDPLALDAASPRGELVEVVGPAATTVLAHAAAAVQGAGEPVAWICADGSVPYPHDLVAAGVDLSFLAVIRAPAGQAARAVELLLSSGGFGFVALDGAPALQDKAVARLRALCRRYRCRAMVAPATGMAALGSTVSLRLLARRAGPLLELEWSKNKGGRGGVLHGAVLRLPPGASARPVLARGDDRALRIVS